MTNKLDTSPIALRVAAAAQDRMAANSREDMGHWHHVLLRDMFRAVADEKESYEAEIRRLTAELANLKITAASCAAKLLAAEARIAELEGRRDRRWGRPSKEQKR